MEAPTGSIATPLITTRTLDQILISVHNFSEIWVIDHSTTTAEAASHSGGNSGMGGDLLYRWGNPAAYDSGSSADQQLFVQHDAQWIGNGLPGAGNILIFNNGQGRPDGDYSSVDEIVPPVASDGSYTNGSAARARLDLYQLHADQLLCLAHLRRPAPAQRQHAHLRWHRAAMPSR